MPHGLAWCWSVLLCALCFSVTPSKGQNERSFECRLPHQLGSRSRNGARNSVRFAYNASSGACSLVWVHAAAPPPLGATVGTVAGTRAGTRAGTPALGTVATDPPPSGDNASLFTSDRACMRSCSREGSVLYPQGAEVCLLPRDTGTCRAHFRLWFFNAERRRCEHFTYGGCRGNGNRFIEEAKCSAVCRHLMEPGDQDRALENREDRIGTGAVAAAVFGALFGVTITVVLVAFAIKRRKRKNRSRTYASPQDYGLKEASF